MSRKIGAFKGNTCIVGRGWAESYTLKKKRPVFSGDRTWYRFYDEERHDPGKSYYIDKERHCAADLVCDFGQLLSPEVIPNGRFDLVILEFLPVYLFDRGRFALANAIRIMAEGGTVEVHSEAGILRDVSGQMTDYGLTCEMGKDINKDWVDGEYVRQFKNLRYVGNGHVEVTPIDKLICRRL